MIENITVEKLAELQEFFIALDKILPEGVGFSIFLFEKDVEKEGSIYIHHASSMSDVDTIPMLKTWLDRKTQ